MSSTDLPGDLGADYAEDDYRPLAGYAVLTSTFLPPRRAWSPPTGPAGCLTASQSAT